MKSGPKDLTFFIGLIFALLSLPISSNAQSPEQIERGKYILHLGGCTSCHTDEKNKGSFLAGGYPLKTPFGIFYSPNITPDDKTGIGGWSDEQFITAMTRGKAQDDRHYFPAFPYTSYAKMTRQDIVDLKAYLDTVPPVANSVQDHDLKFPFGFRFLAGIWKFLFFDTAPLASHPEKSKLWNRGNYLVNGPGHCAECHTPRNLLGGLDEAKRLQGTKKGPSTDAAPSIDPTSGGLKNWSKSDLTFALQAGMVPKGDFLGGKMGKVVANTTSKMTDEDLSAIAEYLFSPNTP